MAELHVQRKRKNYSWLWILILILVIAAAVYWYMNYYQETGRGGSARDTTVSSATIHEHHISIPRYVGTGNQVL